MFAWIAIAWILPWIAIVATLTWGLLGYWEAVSVFIHRQTVTCPLHLLTSLFNFPVLCLATCSLRHWAKLQTLSLKFESLRYQTRQQQYKSKFQTMKWQIIYNRIIITAKEDTCVWVIPLTISFFSLLAHFNLVCLFWGITVLLCLYQTPDLQRIWNRRLFPFRKPPCSV